MARYKYKDTLEIIDDIKNTLTEEVMIKRGTKVLFMNYHELFTNIIDVEYNGVYYSIFKKQVRKCFYTKKEWRYK